MTLQYHYSPRAEAWTRCVASSPAACPFTDEAHHTDRTGLAHRDGGVLSLQQNGVEQRFMVTPVMAGVYGVASPKGTARTYREDGRLISSRQRGRYLEEVLLPRAAVEQSAKEGGRDRRFLAILRGRQTRRQGEKGGPKHHWLEYRDRFLAAVSGRGGRRNERAVMDWLLDAFGA